MKKIISFTTIPSRIHKIKPMVDSILNQSVKPDEIILWLPKTFKRSDLEKEIEIPEYLKESQISIKYCEDVGPFTKLYYSLKQEWDHKDTVIVTVDDDVFYPNKWLKTLIRASKKYPNKAIGFRGRILIDKQDYKTSKLYFGSPFRKPLNVDIITGTWGALYKVGFFTEEIYNEQILQSNFMVDDIWITGNLARNKVERIILKNVGVKLFQEIHEIDGLWAIKKEGNDNNIMLKHFKDDL